ncbi:S24 family peptidase [Pseudacidovorax intermedius]|uniref:S24 family peptidase n=1 Tax=Pseudacidovorax intermedius TaxID=433924 RepID=UPI0026EC52C2|nr:S24 family peptidase [Pseudacidovorax intermedius]
MKIRRMSSGERKTESTPSPTLAANYARIANGRGIEAMRKAMAEAGHAIGNGTLQRLAAGEGVNVGSLRKLALFAGMEVDELMRPVGETDEGFVQVARANVKFSNGHGRVEYYEDDKPPLSFRAEFLRKMGISVGNAVVIDADGNSNEPTIKNGSVVLVNRGDRERLNGALFAFRYDGELLLKRLERIDGVGILATADNPDFKPKTRVYTDLADFEVIGRAVWTGTEL